MQSYSQDLRKRVLWALGRGEGPSAIARRLEVSRVWVYQVRDREQKTGKRTSFRLAAIAVHGSLRWSLCCAPGSRMSVPPGTLTKATLLPRFHSVSVLSVQTRLTPGHKTRSCCPGSTLTASMGFAKHAVGAGLAVAEAPRNSALRQVGFASTGPDPNRR
jgi:hypothetical protein